MYRSEDERERKEAIALIIDHVPAELIRAPRWVTWQYEHRGGKPTKPPYQPNGQPASHSNPKHWSPFSRVLRAFATGKFDGLGFVFAGDDGLVGLDFDGIRNPETGVIEGRALYWLRLLDSYTEVSPSGSGVKVWIRGELPAGRHKRAGLEVYKKQRFFCVTGDVWPGSKPTIETRQAELEKLLAREFPAPQRHKKPRSSRPRRDGHPLNLDNILEEGNVEVFRELTDATAERVYAILCPWWEEHTGGDKSGTRVGRYADGALFFICEHAHCSARGWREFRRAITPKKKLTITQPGYTGPALEVRISRG